MTIPTSDDEKDAKQISILDAKTNKSLSMIKWSRPPQMLVWDEPYLLGLVHNSIEVRVFDKSRLEKDNLVQTIADLPESRFLVSGKSGKNGLIFAASTSSLWCVEEIDIPTQRASLLQDKKWFLAMQLTGMSSECAEDKHSISHEIQTLYAYDLFINKQFREAMLEFSKLNTDPTNVIDLFPNLLPSVETSPAMTRSTSTTHNELMREMPKLVDKDLENGLMALIDYLVEVRQQINYSQDKSLTGAKTFGRNPKTLLSIIDTTLLKCYLETNDSFVASLLRLNNCHLEESEKILKSYKKFNELIILYQTKGQHKRALNLLKTSSLFDADRTIQYLQHLGAEHKKLIFEFADWVLQENPQEGLRIFIEDIQEVENLPRPDVLDFLLKTHKQLVLPYLEHIIDVWNEPKQLFHNILVSQYKEKIFELQSDTDQSQQKKIQLAELRQKLQNFLKSSNKYAADKVLVDLPYTDLFEERAIVLGKLEKHDKVLAIYIQIFGDVDKAIEYCDEVYQQAGGGQHDAYIILMRLLLSPPSQPPYSEVKLHPKFLEPDVESVLDIMDKFALRIDPHAALSVSELRC